MTIKDKLFVSRRLDTTSDLALYCQKHNIKIVINVDDRYDIEQHQLCQMNNVRYYWFPMNECSLDMGMSSIFAAIIAIFCNRNVNIMIHCAAGVNRSQTIYDCIHFAEMGSHTRKEETPELLEHHKAISRMFSGHENDEFVNKSMLEYNCEFGHLPKLASIESFINQLWEHLTSRKEISFDMILLNSGININKHNTL